MFEWLRIFFYLVDGGLSLKFVCPHQVIVSSLTLKNCWVLWCWIVSLWQTIPWKESNKRRTLQTVVIVFESTTLQKFFISHQMIGLTHLRWERMIYIITHFYAKMIYYFSLSLGKRCERRTCRNILHF